MFLFVILIIVLFLIVVWVTSSFKSENNDYIMISNNTKRLADEYRNVVKLKPKTKSNPFNNKIKKSLLAILSIFILSACDNSMARQYFNKNNNQTDTETPNGKNASEVTTEQLLDSLEKAQLNVLENQPDSNVYTYISSYNYELSGGWRDIVTDLNNGALNIPSDAFKVYDSSFLDANNLESGTYIFRNYNDRSSLLAEQEYIVGKPYDVDGYNILDYFVYEAEAILSDDSIPQRASDEIFMLISNDSQYEVLHNENWSYRNGKLLAREYFNNGRYTVDYDDKIYIITRIIADRARIDVYSE